MCLRPLPLGFWPGTLPMQVWVGLVGVILLAAACAGGSVVEPDAQPVVDRLEAAEVPSRYQMTYTPISHSPYVACLGGLDVVDIVLDYETGAARYQVERDAPALVVADDTLFVVDSSTGDVQRAPLSSTPDHVALRDLLGTSLASYVIDGLGTPDLNTLTLAAISVAESVRLGSPPPEGSEQVLVIALDTDALNERITADSDGEAVSEEGPTPLVFEAAIDPRGLATRVVVSSSDREAEGNYAITASYGTIAPIDVPADRPAVLPVEELSFPTPRDSCVFEQ